MRGGLPRKETWQFSECEKEMGNEHNQNAIYMRGLASTKGQRKSSKMYLDNVVMDRMLTLSNYYPAFKTGIKLLPQCRA